MTFLPSLYSDFHFPEREIEKMTEMMNQNFKNQKVSGGTPLLNGGGGHLVNKDNGKWRS